MLTATVSSARSLVILGLAAAACACTRPVPVPVAAPRPAGAGSSPAGDPSADATSVSPSSGAASATTTAAPRPPPANLQIARPKDYRPADEPPPLGTLPEGVGLPVGSKAPAFEAQDASGKPVTLAGLLSASPGAILLVFYRGGW